MQRTPSTVLVAKIESAIHLVSLPLDKGDPRTDLRDQAVEFLKEVYKVKKPKKEKEK